MENNTQEQIVATLDLGKIPIVGSAFRHIQQRPKKNRPEVFGTMGEKEIPGYFH